MRAILIVPVHKIRQLLAERLLAKWYDNNACTFLLETQDESLNNRDTPVLADGAEAGCDPVAFTPTLEHVAPELLALVTDDVFRGSACLYSTCEKVPN
jgi:hypothetical protein